MPSLEVADDNCQEPMDYTIATSSHPLEPPSTERGAFLSPFSRFKEQPCSYQFFCMVGGRYLESGSPELASLRQEDANLIKVQSVRIGLKEQPSKSLIRRTGTFSGRR